MSLVPCICIDDKNRPKEIPQDKWIKAGERYRKLGLYVHLNQNRVQGVTLVEKPLDETCAPYSTFRLSRFGFQQEDITKLLQLAKDCSDLNDMNEADMRRLEEMINEECGVAEEYA